MQERLVFGSPRVRRRAPDGPYGGHGTQAVSLEVEAGVLLAGWLTTPAVPARGLVVWFGGRNEDVGWVPVLASWLGPEWAVCTFNYRGCGASTGTPGEAACVGDAMAIVDWASRHARVAPDQLVLVGRSLGSAVAMQVAARMPPAGLVLLAERDRRVPHGESRRLVRALRMSAPGRVGRSCRVVTIKGTNHRSLPRNAESLDAMARFAAGLRVKPLRPIVEPPATVRANAR